MERRTSWALPPQAPETWIGARWSAALLVGVLLSVLLPVLRLLDSTAPSSLGLAAAAAASASAALLAAYVLLVQSTVTGDVRLRWVGIGYLALAPLVLLRDSDVVSESRLAEHDRAGWLTLLVLVVVPVWTLTAAQAARGTVRALVPATVVAAAALVVVATSDALPALLVDRVPQTALRVLLAVCAALAVGAALHWRLAVTTVGSRRPTGPWAWVWAGLVLTSVAAVAGAAADARWSRSWWIATAAEVVAVAVPALGLALLSSAGYWRQRRRWQQLVAEVSSLRAASPLLPGLSVTPEDDEGLPELPEVRALIDEGRVKVALQPVVRLADGEVVGYEALSRFGGRVPTDRWFRGASRCGLGGELERVTLQAALQLLDQLPESVFLAVNVSPAALDDATVLSLLHAADLSRIVVEVTEHEAVGDYRATRGLLEGLRSRGARIAVDDTGAGFASLRHVLMLQPDVIKLDTSLTRDVQHSERQQSLVVALAGFAAEVGTIVLAEGIETEEQLDKLRELGVPLGQGWHLGVPTVVT